MDCELFGHYNTGGTARNVFVKDTLAYVADGDNGLNIIHYKWALGIKNIQNVRDIYNVSVNSTNGLTINYSLKNLAYVKIIIYNILGQINCFAVNGVKSPDSYSVKCNCNTDV